MVGSQRSTNPFGILTVNFPETPVINLDLYPTFLAAANAPVPAGAKLDGEDLSPLLKQSGPLKRPAIYWHFPGYLDTPVTRGRDPVFRTRPVTAMRSGDWKQDPGRSEADRVTLTS